MAEETNFADVFGGRFASVDCLESFTSLLEVALYLNMVHLSLSEVSVGILENVITDLDLGIAKKVVCSRISFRIEEVLVFFDCLFSMPTASFVSKEVDLSLDSTHRKSESPSERIR